MPFGLQEQSNPKGSKPCPIVGLEMGRVELQHLSGHLQGGLIFALPEIDLALVKICREEILLEHLEEVRLMRELVVRDHGLEQADQLGVGAQGGRQVRGAVLAVGLGLEGLELVLH
jgi:hypothetical protein